ncbi:deoxyguanosinetriphosphate triphosphohydrolase [Piscinibacter gummiphilus]|uniref:Deoxyguanosinetriphosphate triphosphohydrolase-like protein n=1 Tax=Piscinibacter gummiphilus TaxID=946333 RepID=A0ABZ0D1G6_9BURK|nr:deoxyguanosinetriphosphate triphosphohydrolase [Piscinibacter gummiphilus]WOB09296.1 deoxyguanosinetriphosphate triphosphohydrolase [Piscinibacter gummiphilus]
MLKPYACDPAFTRGRRHAEPPAPTRSDYQRDRDRIVHSTAFRRLVYKTQVFLNHEGDLFRTRLTHSLEVAQLGRSIARTLGLNEDLVEAIALAHDLGHTPFGHAGQDALDDCLREADPEGGGFEHNLQSLRVVDTLEERYPEFDGLNLTFETREGILKHCSLRHAKALVANEPDGVARRFVDRTQPSLEAQLCNIADEIAYNAHDVDDGVRSGLIDMEQLDEVPLFARFRREAVAQHPTLAGRRLLFETIRRMLSAQVYDVLEATSQALDEAAPTSVDQARRSRPLVSFTEPMATDSQALKRFLRTNLYRHPKVVATTDSAKQVIRDLFQAYRTDFSESAQGRFEPSPRGIADYIAGMTDRYALKEHERLTGRRLFD